MKEGFSRLVDVRLIFKDKLIFCSFICRFLIVVRAIIKKPGLLFVLLNFFLRLNPTRSLSIFSKFSIVCELGTYSFKKFKIHVTSFSFWIKSLWGYARSTTKLFRYTTSLSRWNLNLKFRFLWLLLIFPARQLVSPSSPLSAASKLLLRLFSKYQACYFSS